MHPYTVIRSQATSNSSDSPKTQQITWKMQFPQNISAAAIPQPKLRSQKQPAPIHIIQKPSSRKDPNKTHILEPAKGMRGLKIGGRQKVAQNLLLNLSQSEISHYSEHKKEQVSVQEEIQPSVKSIKQESLHQKNHEQPKQTSGVKHYQVVEQSKVDQIVLVREELIEELHEREKIKLKRALNTNIAQQKKEAIQIQLSILEEQREDREIKEYKRKLLAEMLKEDESHLSSNQKSKAIVNDELVRTIIIGELIEQLNPAPQYKIQRRHLSSQMNESLVEVYNRKNIETIIELEQLQELAFSERLKKYCVRRLQQNPSVIHQSDGSIEEMVAAPENRIQIQAVEEQKSLQSSIQKYKRKLMSQISQFPQRRIKLDQLQQQRPQQTQIYKYKRKLINQIHAARVSKLELESLYQQRPQQIQAYKYKRRLIDSIHASRGSRLEIESLEQQRPFEASTSKIKRQLIETLYVSQPRKIELSIIQQQRSAQSPIQKFKRRLIEQVPMTYIKSIQLEGVEQELQSMQNSKLRRSLNENNHYQFEQSKYIVPHIEPMEESQFQKSNSRQSRRLANDQSMKSQVLSYKIAEEIEDKLDLNNKKLQKRNLSKDQSIPLFHQQPIQQKKVAVINPHKINIQLQSEEIQYRIKENIKRHLSSSILPEKDDSIEGKSREITSNAAVIKRQSKIIQIQESIDFNQQKVKSKNRRSLSKDLKDEDPVFRSSYIQNHTKKVQINAAGEEHASQRLNSSLKRHLQNQKGDEDPIFKEDYKKLHQSTVKMQTEQLKQFRSENSKEKLKRNLSPARNDEDPMYRNYFMRTNTKNIAIDKQVEYPHQQEKVKSKRNLSPNAHQLQSNLKNQTKQSEAAQNKPIQKVQPKQNVLQAISQQVMVDPEQQRKKFILDLPTAIGSLLKIENRQAQSSFAASPVNQRPKHINSLLFLKKP